MVLFQFMWEPRIHFWYLWQLTFKFHNSHIFHADFFTKFRAQLIHLFANILKSLFMLTYQFFNIHFNLYFVRSHIFEYKFNQLYHFQNLKPSHFIIQDHWRASRFIYDSRANITLHFFIYHSLALLAGKLRVIQLICFLKKSFSWIKVEVCLLKRYPVFHFV